VNLAQRRSDDVQVVCSQGQGTGVGIVGQGSPQGPCL